MMMKRSALKILGLAMSIGLAACSTTGEQPPGDMAGNGDIVGQGAGGASSGAAGEAGGTGASAAGTEGAGNLSAEELLQEPEGALSERVVYFDFDSSQIADEYTQLLTTHGEFLAAHPDTNVIVEGHTDERGSREYNLGLGERRARAVEQVLTLNGASKDQIETVSYGEEQPAVMGNDEQARQKNRRAELVYAQ